MAKRKHLFISHHHGDDAHVDKFTNIMRKAEYDVRNSSVRMKPANERRVEKGHVKDETIKRLLRMKMRWASTVVVLVGPKTHTRPWVNWEIEQASRLGKRIVGVYLHGGTEANVPEALESYAHALVKWSSKSISEAVEDEKNRFETPEGEIRDPKHVRGSMNC